jgi:hypothetical protein
MQASGYSPAGSQRGEGPILQSVPSVSRALAHYLPVGWSGWDYLVVARLSNGRSCPLACAPVVSQHGIIAGAAHVHHPAEAPAGVS